MSQPLLDEELNNYDYNLKIKAGLVPTPGQDGEIDWIGSDLNWRDYQFMYDQWLNN
jgi:hypothetical protein